MSLPVVSAIKNFDVAGMTINIDGTFPLVVNAIETMFCLCPRSEQPPTLHIFGRSCDADRIPEMLPDWLALEMNNSARSLEPIFVSGSNGSSIIVKQEEKVCCAWLSTNHDKIEYVAGIWKDRPTPLTVQPAIVPLLRELMISKQQILLHSAAVRCSDGTGALIAAPGYGGKTTTTMAMIRNGAKLLGDDLTAILPSKGQVHALGIPEPFNLTDQTIAFFPECQSVNEFIPKPNSDGKRVFSPHDIYGADCLIPESDLHVAYFVKISDDGPAVRRMKTVEAMQNFAAVHMFAKDQLINGFSTGRLLDIISQLKVYELKTGPYPDQLGNWLMNNAAKHAQRKAAIA